LAAVADLDLDKAAQADFGVEFPSKPDKGDLFVRVDTLPNKLFRWTGTNWMQLDKKLTDTYLNEDYVEHLTDQVTKGFTDIEDLTYQEQEEVTSAIQRRRSNRT
tara:strand:+ start:153 stop:464 length:312 start_codon:yes stop_codon:yes gene_type:complete